ncbi:NAD(P)/FAD-dependent oxidoreductase [Phormidium sp. CCY1219]|uniref:NAD(P)/FAD-dependent oxidoreductase n=1 Tax=Phormidium sp. CCY1219 TaxID=2886104 RepID=UPI002D1E62A8|nr:NAD(P)/FAD-dependent oxidoreductase [Phormidium sp. CCY1219]MEB3826169.1 NAD(P)/FAD-dependent oxidoreductase [Phormidium sp. CCY1219]
MVDAKQKNSPPHVVIIGGGFGGLYTAQALGRAPVEVTLIDKRNFHLFQPLLYQVATGSLSPGDIASPLRGVLSRNKNTKVLMEEAVDIDPQEQNVILKGKELSYDFLIVATGVSYHYFGNEQWREKAPGLKTVEDALEVRRRILMAFEAAEKEPDPEKRKGWLTFAIAGGGPTGVELAGAIAELAHNTLKEDFRTIDPTSTRILLLEGMDRILPPYPPELSAKAEESLRKLGVTVQTNSLVTNVADDAVTVRRGDREEVIPTRTLLWAAGVKASEMGQVLENRTDAKRDRAGRVIVEADLSLPNAPNIFVIGDLAHYAHQDGKPLPGVAPVAMQEGEYVAKLIKHRLKGQDCPPFQYVDFGSLAVIGRNAAVVDLGFVKFSGFLAWLFWVFVHIYFLIEFDNKLIVMIQWAWNYFTRKRGACLVTGQDEKMRVEIEEGGTYTIPETTESPIEV